MKPENKLLNSLTSDKNGSGKQVIRDAACQNVRPYGSNQEYLYAMREDLADWLKGLYAIEINVDNFFTVLETGTVLCQHANNITTCAEYVRKNNIKIDSKYITKFPTKFLLFNQGKYVRASSFFARDNIASFIGWCRNELQIPESVMFETNDLVLRYNEKNVILCLLEVARRGSKFGVPAPVLVQIEEDIDKEIEFEKRANDLNEPPPEPVQQKVTCDFKSLDEMVQHILGMCTCPRQFPMVRVGDGKYKVGDSENLIFMRILRQHVMVRVGGGWDTLEHYLNKHDPCRCFRHKTDKSMTPRQSRSRNAPGRPSLHQQSSLPSSPPKSANKQPAVSSRFSKSTSNLNDLALTSRSEKTANRRSTILRSTNSTSSETSSSDTRLSKSQYLNSPERRKATSTSVNRKEKLSLPTEDVFSRLSRPKSTPPISKNLSVQQNDHLVVQRSKKGGHRVQRTTVSEPQSTPRSQTARSRTPADKSELRSKSVFTTPSNYLRKKDSSSASSRPARPNSVSIPSTPRSRPARATTSSVASSSSSSFMRNNRSTGPKTPRPKSTIGVFPSRSEKNSQARPSTPKTTRSTDISVFEVADDKEKQMLKAFEKECISNQYSLQREQIVPRKSSDDKQTERRRRLSSRSSAEDSEIAMHFRNASEKHDVNRPSHPPSSYNSLSRPRKDKVDKHEHPTRIPTPISFNRSTPLSFNRPQLNGKAPESNNAKREPKKSSEAKEAAFDESPPTDVNVPPAPPSVQATPTKNPTPAKTPADLRQPRYTISVEEINRLLNSQRSVVENRFRPRTTSAIVTTVPQADSTSLRSSGHPAPKDSDNYSAFAPVSNHLNGDEKPKFANSQQHSPPSAYPNYFRKPNRHNSVRNDMNHNDAGYPDNQRRNGFKQDNLGVDQASNRKPFVEPHLKRNGVRASFSSKSSSLDEQWV